MNTALYRIWDRTDQLLYIGISKSALRRIGQHLTDKYWANDVDHVTFEKFHTREQAAAAEILAIKAENPLHNVVHNRRKGIGQRAKQIKKYAHEMQIGDPVALGLFTGKCPIGIIISSDSDSVTLALKSFVTGFYGHESMTVYRDNIYKLIFGTVKDQVVDDAHLGAFQTDWELKHQPYEEGPFALNWMSYCNLIKDPRRNLADVRADLRAAGYAFKNMSITSETYQIYCAQPSIWEAPQPPILTPKVPKLAGDWEGIGSAEKIISIPSIPSQSPFFPLNPLQSPSIPFQVHINPPNPFYRRDWGLQGLGDQDE